MSEISVVNIPSFVTLTLAMVVFFVGASLTRKVAFLRNFNIPEPVSGGVLTALVIWALYSWAGTKIEFDLSARDGLLVMFFTTIGLNARLSDLARGGGRFLILLVVTVAFIILQNGIGLFGALLFDLPKAAGVLFGSASLIGGLGTTIAWAPVIQADYGFASAQEVGVASATLGLVVAALVGGPIAKFLIEKHKLKPRKEAEDIVGLAYEKDEVKPDKPAASMSHINLMQVLLVANIAIMLGYILDEIIEEFGLNLPLFVPCLLAGIFLSNTVPYIFKSLPWPARSNAMAVVSEYCLSVFLAMSLMSMQLWALAGMGGPIFLILTLQVVATIVLVIFVFFKIMGSDYTAAVLGAGFAGFTLGATPTAIANMSSVTKRYGAAPLAFVILPLVSAFFVDLANAMIIQFFVGL